jgi:ankyrin repeat domain-containing protein 50
MGSNHDLNLLKYAKAGNATKLCTALRLCSDPNHSNDEADDSETHGFTALHLSAFYGHSQCIRSLLKDPRVDVNRRVRGEYTALYMAAERKFHGCMRLLLAAPGVDVNAASTTGATPLLCAAQNGHE